MAYLEDGLTGLDLATEPVRLARPETSLLVAQQHLVASFEKEEGEPLRHFDFYTQAKPSAFKLFFSPLHLNYFFVSQEQTVPRSPSFPRGALQAAHFRIA